MKKIKVLMVTVTFGEGSGVNSFIMNYFRNIDHSKVQIDVLAYKESPTGESPYIQEIENNGGKYILLSSKNNIFKHIQECKKILTEGNYDIVHNNSLIITIPFMVLSKLHKVKVRIQHSHSSKLGDNKKNALRNRLLVPFLTKQANVLFACSDAAGKEMFKRKKFQVWPNAIDPTIYHFKQEVRNAYRNSEKVDDKTVIISVGRACEAKNPFFALDIFKELSLKMPEAVYWWVGDGPFLDAMKKHAEELRISDKVVFLGKRSDVVELYCAADVFFLPSLFEGLPLTGVEAQAMGLPSVVSQNVTTEMVYTDLIKYVGLEMDRSQWVQAIIDQSEIRLDREHYSRILRESCFSSIKAGQILQNCYEELVNET